MTFKEKNGLDEISLALLTINLPIFFQSLLKTNGPGFLNSVMMEVQ